MANYKPTQDESKRLKKTHYKQNETVSFTWLGEFLIGKIEKITKTNTEVVYSIRDETTGIRYPCRLAFGQVNKNSAGKIGFNATTEYRPVKRHHVEDNNTTSNVSDGTKSTSANQHKHINSESNSIESGSTRATKTRRKDTTRSKQDSKTPLNKFFSVK
jgi:hypothetical protein